MKQKYRIVEVRYSNRKWFEIQYKLLWWWRTVCEEWFCQDGLSGYSTLEFKSVEDAENYINKCTEQKRDVVKYL